MDYHILNRTKGGSFFNLIHLFMFICLCCVDSGFGVVSNDYYGVPAVCLSIPLSRWQFLRDTIRVQTSTLARQQDCKSYMLQIHLEILTSAGQNMTGPFSGWTCAIFLFCLACTSTWTLIWTDEILVIKSLTWSVKECFLKTNFHSNVLQDKMISVDPKD